MLYVGFLFGYYSKGVLDDVPLCLPLQNHPLLLKHNSLLILYSVASGLFFYSLIDFSLA